MPKGRLKPPSPVLADYEAKQQRLADDARQEKVLSGVELHSTQLRRLTRPELVEYANMAPGSERNRAVEAELQRRTRNRAVKKAARLAAEAADQPIEQQLGEQLEEQPGPQDEPRDKPPDEQQDERRAA